MQFLPACLSGRQAQNLPSPTLSSSGDGAEHQAKPINSDPAGRSRFMRRSPSSFDATPVLSPRLTRQKRTCTSPHPPPLSPRRGEFSNSFLRISQFLTNFDTGEADDDDGVCRFRLPFFGCLSAAGWVVRRRWRVRRFLSRVVWRFAALAFSAAQKTAHGVPHRPFRRPVAPERDRTHLLCRCVFFRKNRQRGFFGPFTQPGGGCVPATEF